MNRLSIVSASLIAASTMFAALQAQAAVPQITVPIIDVSGYPAIATCGLSSISVIYYSEAIAFEITGPLTAATSTDQTKLNALPRAIRLDIKIRSNPGQISNLKAKVLSFLRAKTDAENAQAISITSVVSSATLCYPQGW